MVLFQWPVSFRLQRHLPVIPLSRQIQGHFPSDTGPLPDAAAGAPPPCICAQDAARGHVGVRSVQQLLCWDIRAHERNVYARDGALQMSSQPTEKCCFKQTSWEFLKKPQDERSGKDIQESVITHSQTLRQAAAVHATPRSQHPVGRLRKETVAETSCSSHYVLGLRPFGYINYPGKRTARGALSSCGTEGWLGGTHMFTTRQGRRKTVKEGSEHHTDQPTLFSPSFPRWPHRPKTFLLFSLHITSQWFSASTNCSLTIPLVAVHCLMGWPATAGSAFPW